MKNFLITLLTISIFFGCTKETSEISIEEASLRANKVEVQKTERKLIRSTEINCKGTCDGTNGQEQCATLFDFNNPDQVECSCEGCVMEISRTNEKSYSVKSLEIVNFYGKELKNHVLNSFKTSIDRIFIDNIAIDEYTDVKTIYIEYHLETSKEKYSVMLVDYDDEGRNSGDVVVDCSGPCESPEQTCRERFIFSSGAVECTCAGDCVMTVTER